MKKGILIRSDKVADVINLYFEKDTVTVRTFLQVRDGRELEIAQSKIGHLSGEDVTSIFKTSPDHAPDMAVQFSDAVSADGSPEALREKARTAKFELARTTALTKADLTKDARNLEGRVASIEGDLYLICKQTTFRMPPNVWEPYGEVCMTLMKNTGRYPGRHMVAFFDRNAATYNGRESFHQFHTKFKLSGNYVAFRWFVLPGTDLLTAPVVATPIPRVITNLDMDDVSITVPDQILDGNQRKSVDEAVEALRDYWLPKVTIVGPDTIRADGTAEFTLRCVHQGGKVCPDEHEYMVEALDGFAPHRRVTVKNGQGSFRLIALGLRAGEKMRVKINDKYWASRAEKTLKVI